VGRQQPDPPPRVPPSSRLARTTRTASNTSGGRGRLADRNDNQHRRTAALALTGTAAPVMATEPKPPNPTPTGSTSAVPPVTAANAPVAVTV
jgi:hypothetical protein